MKKISKKSIWLISLTVLLSFAMVACNKKEVTQNETEAGKTEEKEAGIPFPYELEDGKILVNSLFQSSIDNPDCENEYCEDLASLEITNQSDEYCEKIQITVTTLDGKKFSFVGEDIPAGASVWMFENNNQTMEMEEKCEEITSKAKFGQAHLMEDKVSVSVDETKVTLKNLTDQDLEDLRVSCHCNFDGIYFGGKVLQYAVESIPAGESTVVDAMDCFLGTAEVVRIFE